MVAIYRFSENSFTRSYSLPSIRTWSLDNGALISILVIHTPRSGYCLAHLFAWHQTIHCWESFFDYKFKHCICFNLGSDGSNPIPTADVYADHGATPNAWNATGDAH